MEKNEIHVIYGSSPKSMVLELLQKIKPETDIKPEMLIGIKPNLIVAKPSTEGATTSPEIVSGVIEYLQGKGFKNIIILESSWVGDNTKRAFKVCGYEEISKKYGVPLFDLKDDTYETRRVKELDIKICSRALKVDYLVDMPVLKAHCQTKVTCSLKNLKGCIPDIEKRRFHSLGLFKPIGYLGAALKCGLIIVDAMNGDLTFEEGGNPVQMDRIIAGKDPVLVDTYGASLLGYSKEEIEYIAFAEEAGAGSSDLQNARIVEYNEHLKRGSRFKPSSKAKRLSEKVIAKDACSACYGSLIHALQRMDEDGEFKRIKDKIYIGQGFRGKCQDGIGIGNCTAKFEKNVKGCPASARDIIDYLKDPEKR